MYQLGCFDFSSFNICKDMLRLFWILCFKFSKWIFFTFFEFCGLYFKLLFFVTLSFMVYKFNIFFSVILSFEVQTFLWYFLVSFNIRDSKFFVDIFCLFWISWFNFCKLMKRYWLFLKGSVNICEGILLLFCIFWFRLFQV